MRCFASAVALTVILGTLAGCQSKEAKVESKQSASENRQKEITRLQNQWNSVVATSIADCPTTLKMLEGPKTPECIGLHRKAQEIEAKLKQLVAEQAAE